jgi:hypothetical protein
VGGKERLRNARAAGGQEKERGGCKGGAEDHGAVKTKHILLPPLLTPASPPPPPPLSPATPRRYGILGRLEKKRVEGIDRIIFLRGRKLAAAGVLPEEGI